MDKNILYIHRYIFDISDIDDVRHDIGDDRYIVDISILDRYITDISVLDRYIADISILDQYIVKILGL